MFHYALTLHHRRPLARWTVRGSWGLSSSVLKIGGKEHKLGHKLGITWSYHRVNQIWTRETSVSSPGPLSKLERGSALFRIGFSLSLSLEGRKRSSPSSGTVIKVSSAYLQFTTQEPPDTCSQFYDFGATCFTVVSLALIWPFLLTPLTPLPCLSRGCPSVRRWQAGRHLPPKRLFQRNYLKTGKESLWRIGTSS